MEKKDRDEILMKRAQLRKLLGEAMILSSEIGDVFFKEYGKLSVKINAMNGKEGVFDKDLFYSFARAGDQIEKHRMMSDMLSSLWYRMED